MKRLPVKLVRLFAGEAELFCCCCFQPSISINYGKDFKQDEIELVARGPPGGYVFTSAVDYEFMWRGALPFITEQMVGLFILFCFKSTRNSLYTYALPHRSFLQRKFRE